MEQEHSIQLYIDKIFTGGELLEKKLLEHLSGLSGKDVESFRQAWDKAHVKRKSRIISHLVTLAEKEPKLDFSIIFSYCLDDPDDDVKTQAIHGLEEEDDPRHIARLIPLVAENTSLEVRTAAVSALGKFALMGEMGDISRRKTDEVYAALMKVLEDGKTPARLRAALLEAVSPFTVPRVKQLIESTFKSSDLQLKVSAIRAMGRNCDPDWLKYLSREMHSEQAEIRYEVAVACGEICTDDSIPLLLELVEDSDTRVQEAAIAGLGEIGGKEAKDVLTDLARSPKPRIKRAARTALKEMEFCTDPLSMNM